MKRNLYERVGVREYWIVDSFEHAVEQFVLTSGKYIQQPHESVVEVSYLTGVTVDLAEVR